MQGLGVAIFALLVAIAAAAYTFFPPPASPALAYNQSAAAAQQWSTAISYGVGAYPWTGGTVENSFSMAVVLLLAVTSSAEHMVHSLPRRAPSPRCTAESVRHVWHRSPPQT